ncbi:hypothetical protein BC937DRAFT_89034 [Endogone sp. FLAS-F59071]|nr:hypothetical protein BC937DRAFT_89034 [Endogone sp. FLAS-F59071]|eukprot:RUS18207.1 hypothetical protein BC937DRAFT_89034 [Endogone sp. FLAS-F59071]
MALDLARGLQHVHSKGFIHGNINCSSFLIRKDYSIALSGFNMSNTVPYHFSNSSVSSNSNSVVNVDIFSLGVLLWEISALRPAFENVVDPEEWREILKDGKREIVEPGTPKQYQNLYDQCWNTDSSKWPNMKTIVENLIQLAQSFDDSDRRWGDSATLVVDNISNESKVNVFEIFNELRKVYSHVIPIDELTIKQYRYKWGGYADVHQGVWRRKNVAIKVQIKALANITREVEILNLVTSHPNIVTLEGIAQEKSTHHPYIVMELAKCSLYEYIHGTLYGNFIHQRVDLCVGIANGLAYLHQLDILHCDLHSSNVLISAKNQPLISDFGLSRTLAQARETLITKEYGRVAYTATERLKSKHPPPFEPSQDVFSLGVIIWETLSGKRPSEGYGRINPDRGGPILDYPAELIALYQQCASDTPSNRPVANTVVHELRKILAKIRPEIIRITLDEYIIDLARPLRAIPSLDVDTVLDAGIRGQSDLVVLSHAISEQRILVTSDTDYLFANGFRGPVLLLWGLLGNVRFIRLKAKVRTEVVTALFREHLREIEWLGTTKSTTIATLSGDLDNFMWTIRKATEEEMSNMPCRLPMVYKSAKPLLGFEAREGICDRSLPKLTRMQFGRKAPKKDICRN